MKTLITILSLITTMSIMYGQNEMDIAYTPGNDPYTLNSPYNFGHDEDVLILPVDNDYSNVVRNLTTSGYAGYGNVFIPFEEKTQEDDKTANDADNAEPKNNKNWDYEVTYPEGTQLTADEGQEYDTVYFAPFAEFEDQSDVIRQTMTSTVEYTTLYVPKGQDKDQPKMYADDNVELDVVETNSIATSDADANIEGMLTDIDLNSVSKVGYVSPSIDGKILVITEENGYRYFDDKTVVGDSDIVNEITESGKPISELTFYYMMIDYNIISESDFSANEFLNLSIEEQIEIVSPLLNGVATR